MHQLIVALVLALCTPWITQKAFAEEPPERRVIELNWQAIEAYNRLEIDNAESTLRRALDIAKQQGIVGPPIGRIYMVMGIVAIGGRGRVEQGRELFLQALHEDPEIKLDPLLATPEIQATFEDARKKFRSQKGVVVRKNADSTLVLLRHRPVEEQLRNTAVPVYVEAPEDVSLGHIYLFYRKPGADEYTQAEMRRIENGWGFEIPCKASRPPIMEYYIVAESPEGNEVGYVGSPDDPMVVPIVTERVSAEIPALPGRRPPEPCSLECAPGEECDENDLVLGEIGDACRSDNDCSLSLICDEGICAPKEKTDQLQDAPPFFVHVGFTWGSAYVTEGMQADSAPPPDDPNFGQSWIRDDADPQDSCSDDDADTPSYCVRVEKAGFVPTAAFRIGGGYYFSPRLALAGMFRIQPQAGFGDLPGILFSGRFQYLVTAPTETGLWLSLHVGGSIGQIQPQPEQPSGTGRPYAISGLGGMQGGTTLGVRFIRNLGIFLSPEVNFLFPTILFDIDVTGGVEVAF